MRALVFMSLLLVSLALLLVLQTQRELFDPKYQTEELISANEALSLKKWKIQIKECDPSSTPPFRKNCGFINIPSTRTDLPVRKKFLDKIPLAEKDKIRIATFTYSFSAFERAFLNDINPENFLFFVVPRSKHSQIILQSPEVARRTGKNIDAKFGIKAKKFRDSDKIIFHAILTNGVTSALGSADFSPLLVKYSSASKIVDFGKSIGLALQLFRQIEIGIPVIISALALVVDHTKVLPSLAIFSSLRALRSLIYATNEESRNWDTVIYLYLGIFLLNALMTGSLYYFLKKFCNNPVRFIEIFAAGTVGLIVNVIIFYSFKIPKTEYWNKGEYYFDCFLGLAGVIFTLINLLQIKKKSNDSNHSKGESELLSSEHLKRAGIDTESHAVYYLKYGLIFTAFILAIWVNAHGFTLLSAEGFNDFYDWKHLTLVPMLLIASFLDVGSTVKTIQVVAKTFTDKARVDRDIEISKKIQADTLPPKKHHSEFWNWRALHFTASSLAGDWFDIRELKLANGKTVLASCIVDVTGHGIGSALMTSNIASHWSLWCRDLQNITRINDSQGMQEFLSLAPNKIHQGLVGLRYNLGCSLAAMVFDPEENSISYLTAGHPGIIICNNEKFHYLTSTGNRPGNPADEPKWESKSIRLEGNSSVYLYTDGIAPIGGSVSRWASRLKKDWIKSEEKDLNSLLIKQLRTNHREFRKDRSIEDDLTLIILSLKSKLS